MSIVDTVYNKVKDQFAPCVRDIIYAQLSDMILPQIPENPTRLRRRKIIEWCTRKFYESLVKPHEPVGIRSVQSIAEQLVRSSLSSHHYGGIRRGATGFTRIEELTNLKNKSDVVRIITKPYKSEDILVPQGRDEVAELANIILGITVNDIYSTYEIIESEEYPEWYDIFKSIFRTPTQNKWLRIWFDPISLYRYRISVPMISEVITNYFSKQFTILFPPTEVGLFIDIHLGFVTEIEQTAEERYIYYLGQVLSLYVSGNPTVTSAYPMFENMLKDLIVHEVDEGRYELVASVYVPDFAWENMIRVFVPTAVDIRGKTFTSNMNREQIEDQILGAGRNIIYHDVLEERIVNEDGSVTLYFDTTIMDRYPAFEYADLEPITLPNNQEADDYLLDNMIQAHLFWYVEGVCSNLAPILNYNDVDPIRTYTTSPRDLMATVGYLAMRNMLYTEFKANIDVDPIHVKLVINNMTKDRTGLSYTRHGVKVEGTGFLSYATFEDVLRLMRSAAFCGEMDTVGPRGSISANILTGTKINIGRGGKNLKTKNEFEEALRRRYEK